MEPNDKLVF
jgi:hypothetical protein